MSSFVGQCALQGVAVPSVWPSASTASRVLFPKPRPGIVYAFACGRVYELRVCDSACAAACCLLIRVFVCVCVRVCACVRVFAGGVHFLAVASCGPLRSLVGGGCVWRVSVFDKKQRRVGFYLVKDDDAERWSCTVSASAVSRDELRLSGSRRSVVAGRTGRFA